MYMLMLIPIFLREKNWGHADNNKQIILAIYSSVHNENNLIHPI
jgi:hypothetical protein